MHIQYNVVSSNTKLYLFLRVVNEMENSKDNLLIKLGIDLQVESLHSQESTNDSSEATQ